MATTAEDRAGMYEDLHQLLVPGFLTAKVTVDGHVYSLRSLAIRDLYLIAGVARERAPEWRTWAVAASVWMVDGVPLLEDSTLAPRTLFRALNKSHPWVVTTLFAVVANFFLRSRRVGPYLESYLYEEESRRIWKATKDGHISLSHRSGIPGAERLGLNQVQSSWVAWNRAEDQREEQEYQWSLAKVNVSLQSAKSSQKLEARDKSRLEAEKSRRAGVQEQAYQIYTGQRDEHGDMVTNVLGMKVHRIATHADLAEEFRRWVSDERDDHDKIVEDYKNRVREEFAAREAEKARILDEVRRRREREEEMVLGTTGTRSRLVGLSPEEMARKFPQGAKPGARFIQEADPGSRLFNRYLRDRQDVHPDASKVEPVDPAPVPSLNERISGRKTRIPDGR